MNMKVLLLVQQLIVFVKTWLFVIQVLMVNMKVLNLLPILIVFVHKELVVVVMNI